MSRTHEESNVEGVLGAVRGSEAARLVGDKADAERAFEAIFRGAYDAMIIADDEGRYVDVNSAACELFGREREQLVGETVALLIDAGIVRVVETWDHFLERGRSEGAVEVTRPGGEVRIAEYRASANVLPARHLSVLRDVTEQVQLEEQYRQTQKIQAIGQLAGGVAHDFNNLLTAIIGYSALALAALRDGEGPRAEIEQIQAAAEHAAELTQKLLAFSRRQTLNPEPVLLSEATAEVLPLLQRLIGAETTITPTLPPGLPHTLVDVGSLDQILVNLAVNARDAMPAGGEITIETGMQTIAGPEAKLLDLPPGDYLTLRFSDNGCGMDAETCARVYEPFFTTKDVGDGTGLGLATVHGIVKQSGGAIELDSTPGVGTTFLIYLPVVGLQPDVVQTPIPPTEPLSGTVSTILVCDDQPLVRAMLRTVLEASGYVVLEADGPDRAEQLADTETFDLLLTDVVMPGKSGVALAENLRKARPGLPVIFISGFSPDLAADRGVVESANSRYLAKPFTNAELLGLLRAQLAAAES